MRLATFTHANVKESETKHATVYGDLDLISFWYYSASAKATILMAPGAALPVLESPEAVKKLKLGDDKNESKRKRR